MFRFPASAMGARKRLYLCVTIVERRQLPSLVTMSTANEGITEMAIPTAATALTREQGY